MCKKNLIFFIMGFICCWNVYSQTYPPIHTHRPRIWADQQRFDWLVSNIDTGECGETFSEFKYRYDNWWITDPELYMAGTDSSLWTWNWNSSYVQWEGIFTVFLWKITYDPLAMKRCHFLVRKFYERRLLFLKPDKIILYEDVHLKNISSRFTE